MAAATLVILYVFACKFLLFHLAKESVLGKGPFERHVAVALLDCRGRDSDYKFLWDELARTDWNEPRADVRDERPSVDWRQVCIERLVRHDSGAAAERLCVLLAQRPNGLLAEWAAPCLAEEQRYDAVPILLRYALLGDRHCAAAAEQLGVPEAALALLRIAETDAIGARFDMAVGQRRLPSPGDFGELTIEPDMRARLARLLGRNAGPKLSDWYAVYNESVPGLQTPLSDAQRRESARVAHCFGRYWAALDAWREAKADVVRERAIRQMRQAGLDKELQTIQRYFEKADPNDAPWVPPLFGEEADAFRKMDEYLDKAEKAIVVDHPNFNVATTEGLEREVDAFVQRIEELLRNADSTKEG